MNLIYIFKRFLSNIAPYGLVRWYLSKREHKYIDDYLSFKALNEIKEFDKTPNYKQIVTIQGFGYSGSGALIDLLREYDDCQVLGYVDSEGSLSNKKIAFGEMDFLRHSGGFFEIEKFIGDNNIFHNDLLLHRFLKLISKTNICTNRKIQSMFYSVFDKISNFQIWNANERSYNNYFLPKGKSEIFFLKLLDRKEYISIVKNFLTSLFVELNPENKEKIVLDQFFSDTNFDYAHYTQYVDNIKYIVVYRDPRDVYTYAKIKDISWIAHDTVEDFISWCEIMYSRFSNNSSDYLSLRFEDIVLKYDETVAIIEEYLGLSPEKHLKKHRHLDPVISAKNVAIWKKYDEYKRDFIKIKRQLSLYCYDN